MKAALIADDLTGNNNAGVLVAKQHFSTISVPHHRPIFPEDCQIVCIDTDSRYIASDDARRRVAEMSKWATDQGATALCNRVDNLLRGNIGAEVCGMLDFLGSNALAVVSPAFPALGRLVVDGKLLVNNQPVHENPIAAGDPFAPVRHSAIADIIADQFETFVAHIYQGELGDDPAMLATKLDEVAAHANVVVVDQGSDDDVKLLAKAMAKIKRPVFPVDPGPLSALYLKALSRRKLGRQGAKLIVGIGSVTAVSEGQIKYLLAARQLTPIYLDPMALISGASERGGAIKEAVDAVLASKGNSDITVLTTRRVEDPVLDLATMAEEREITTHGLSKEISDGLAEAIVSSIVQSDGDFGGCFCSGGDVTASLFSSAGTEAIRIFGDIIPLTAHVAFIGGQLDKLQLVTKGGSIGEVDAMDTCLSFLQDALKH